MLLWIYLWAHVQAVVVASLLQELGVGVKTVVAADMKKCAREFQMHNFSDRVTHIVCDVTSMADNSVAKLRCCQCAGPCSIDYSVRPDLTCAGPPCQPYSQLRWQGGKGRNQGAARSHGAYHVLSEFVHYLFVRRPLGFVLEEVLRFLSKDPQTKLSFSEAFLNIVERLGYHGRAIKLKATSWCPDVSRERRVQSCVRV